jgi:hypothetical protein
VAEVPDQPEDQKRDEEDVQLFSFVTKLLGQQRTMAKAMTQLADGLYEIAKAFEATELDVRKLREAAYRAGREDAARAGYAEAVARLRDDERYRNWWTAAPERSFGTAYWAPEGRQHLADYLETVGPDGLDVTTGGLFRG